MQNGYTTIRLMSISQNFQSVRVLIEEGIDIDGRWGDDYSAYTVVGRAVFEF